MEITIVRDKDEYSLYVNDQFYGNYDSPVQAAQAAEEMFNEEENQNGRI